MTPLESARSLLNAAIIEYRGEPIGTVAAMDPSGLVADNYQDCFVRDFVSSALVFLSEGNTAIVRNFLTVVMELHQQRAAEEGHRLNRGVMPASFRVVHEQGKESIHADFGDRAIGRVTPVDSILWWLLLLDVYRSSSGDAELSAGGDFQCTIREILEMLLTEGFEEFPTLLVPDGAFMIDRRMGVDGHPLEIQVLFYGALSAVDDLLLDTPENQPIRELAAKRRQSLRAYIRDYYWLDMPRLNQIHRFNNEEAGHDSANIFNIYPESIPEWLEEWLPDDAGYLVGNLGASRMDFRFFAGGNLMAVLFGVVYRQQAEHIIGLYEARWDELVGAVPLKICYPARWGRDWRLLTGCDPKNVAWSYHNGGSWPALLYALVGAALSVNRRDLAGRALQQAEVALMRDDWPEYYDGLSGRLIGRRANRRQLWSAAGYLYAHHVYHKGLLKKPESGNWALQER